MKDLDDALWSKIQRKEYNLVALSFEIKYHVLKEIKGFRGQAGDH